MGGLAGGATLSSAGALPLPAVSAVALAGDGSVMLTGGTDCVVCLWSDSASARALGSKEACQGDGFELQARRRPR